MPGCTACPAGWASPTCLPARCSRRWPDPRPATCSAIGSAGIPEMRKRGYSGGFAAGIIAAGGTLGILLPPSITMILFAVAAEKSLGRLFLAGIGPGLLLVTLFGDLCGDPLPQGICRRQRALRQDRRDLGDPAARRVHHGRALQRAAAGAAVRAAADRRHDRALWRLCDAVGNRRPRRPAGAGADRADLQRLAAFGSRADPEIDHPRIHHADDDHRHVAAVFLRDELSAHLAVGRGVDRGDAPAALGIAGGDPGHGGGARLLPAAGVDHPDDRADHPAAACARPISTSSGSASS